VPRKNGKSTISAGIALYLLFADKEHGVDVYSAAASVPYKVQLRDSPIYASLSAPTKELLRLVLGKGISHAGRRHWRGVGFNDCRGSSRGQKDERMI
jgi:hypothetical protein